jgi:hypothetical protein
VEQKQIEVWVHNGNETMVKRNYGHYNMAKQNYGEILPPPWTLRITGHNATLVRGKCLDDVHVHDLHSEEFPGLRCR